jgi:hypothetical protein
VKRSLKIAIILICFLAAVYFSLWAVIDLKGKDLLVSFVEDKTGQSIEVGSLEFVFPFGVLVRDISSEDFTAGKIKATASLSRTFTGILALNTLTLEDAFIEVSKKDEEVNFPVLGAMPFAGFSEGVPLVSSKDKDSDIFQKSFNFYAGKIFLNNVTVQFSDYSKKQDFQISLENLKGFIYNAKIPFSQRKSFDIESDLRVNDKTFKDNLSLSGWIDFSSKSMDVNLSLGLIPYSGFSMYYPSFWRPGNLGLVEAVFSLDVDFISEENDLVIKGNLLLLEHEFKVTDDNQTKVAIAKGILGMFSQNKKLPGFEFLIETKFDDPKIDFSKISAQLGSGLKRSDVALTIGREVLKGAVRDTMGKPREATQKVLETGTDTTKKAVDLTGKAVQEILKAPQKAGDFLKSLGGSSEAE